MPQHPGHTDKKEGSSHRGKALKRRARRVQVMRVEALARKANKEKKR